MSAVINGRRYDTDTAGLIGLNAAGDGLYKKRTGEYFVARAIPREDGLPARGNANRYIVPLGLSAARDWARQNLPPAIVEQEFPDAPTRVRASFELDGRLLQDMRAAAVVTREKPSQFVEAAIRERLGRLKNPERRGREKN